MQDFHTIAVRSPAILTDAYVAGTIIGRNTTEPNIITTTNNDQLVLLYDFTIGSLTSAEIKVEFANELYYSIAYDGQSANFTAGLTVTGGTSRAKAVIVSDTDAGATGTLIVKSVIPGPTGQYFIDNEALTDSSTGVAVVNGAMSPLTSNTADTCWYQEVVENYSSGNLAVTAVVHQLSASGRGRIAIPIKDRYIRISSKGTGTVDGSLLGIIVNIGTTA
jgi:hypothetical protein